MSVDSARVRRDHRRRTFGRLAQIVREELECGEMVERLVDESLDLARVEVEADDAVRSGGNEQVTHHASRDRFARAPLLVLSGVAVEGHDRCDPLRRRALECVDHDQLLHDVEVDRRRVALDHEGISAADTLRVVDVDLAVGENRALHAPKFDTQDVSHLLGERFIG
jgi:hypothetical protein